jgi:hypothetical protein
MIWDRNKSLPVDTLEGETLEQFQQRVIDTLNHSTNKVVKIINTEVKFA